MLLKASRVDCQGITKLFVLSVGHMQYPAVAAAEPAMPV